MGWLKPPSGMGWESDAVCVERAGGQRADGAGGKKHRGLASKVFPAGPSQGAEVEDWDLESLDLCRHHVQALGDPVCSVKISGMRRNPPG